MSGGIVMPLNSINILKNGLQTLQMSRLWYAAYMKGDKTILDLG